LKARHEKLSFKKEKEFIAQKRKENLSIISGTVTANCDYLGTGNFIAWLFDENGGGNLLANDIGSCSGYTTSNIPRSLSENGK